MPSWVERWQKRQRELASGVDADLVLANRRRFKLAFGLLVLSFGLVWLDTALRLPNSWDIVLGTTAVICFVVAFLTGRWALHERQFLTRPDSEGPPDIFKSE